MATSTLASIGSSSTTNSSSSNLQVTGLASGMNWSTIITELANAERSPEIAWQKQQTAIAAQNASYSTITGDLTTLQTDAQTLQDPSFYRSVVAASSNSSVASAGVSSGTPIGNYAFNISQMATQSQVNGVAGVSQPLVPDGNPANTTVGGAGFATPVTAGTFTVNGAQVTIATTDSLQTVFNNIASATSNQVTASYNASTDEISLTSAGGSPIVLGSATDTSNFLQSAQLYNNGTGTVTSTAALGHVSLSSTLNAADLKTAITDGGSGNGAFTINGVTINYNASTYTLQDVVNNINASAAGVTAAYDPIKNQFTLTNKNTGDVGISMQDVTGNLLAATGLSTGTLSRGNNLIYTLNGGSQQIVSQSNTIGAASSGVTGLTVTALSTGSTTVNVSSDTTTISNAIQKFVTDYNSLQSYISSQQSVTTGANGAVTPGTLTGDSITNNIASKLRSIMGAFENLSGGSGAVKQLSDLGFQSNGHDNTIAFSNPTALSSLLTNNLSAVASFFSDATNGMGVQMNNYVTATIGLNGTLPTRTADLTQQSTDIGTQISNLENKIANDTAQWNAEFTAMETAQSQTNQELTYLSQGVANGSL